MEKEILKYEKAIECLMKEIGYPDWCPICDDWFPANHFKNKHIQK